MAGHKPGHNPGQYPNYGDQYSSHDDYPTQSYAEYQHSVKQNQVFASDKKAEEKAKKQQKKKSKRNRLIAVGAMVFVIAGAIGLSYSQDSTVEENFNDGVSNLVDDANEDITNLNASSDGEAALAYAQELLDRGHYSESQLRSALTSEYGEVYTQDAADHALVNIDADWNAEALEAAESYIRHSHYSYEGLIHQLSAPSGNDYTEEQSRYAADNVDADWYAEAVEAFESYWSNENIDVSPEELRTLLTSDTVGRFTEDQIDHAMQELGFSA
ncbi:Ltp family lipoprotein [Corynebacterium sp.]|uniref:Ltp family lipoprotein n=1 Tax=Corynebacterium sp. TaxID=1720 RepID=UPI0028A7405C|nr:Ltp family lipoprotein [Corynebacterium sp.]